MSHELVRLAALIEWEEFDRQWGPLFSEKRGAPAIPTRLIAGLHYLKHRATRCRTRIYQGYKRSGVLPPVPYRAVRWG